MNARELEQIEYIDISAWRKAVREALMRNSAQMRSLNAEIRSMAERLEALGTERIRLESEAKLIAQALDSYAAREQAPSKRSPVAGDNLREVLIINCASADGLIIGRDAATALVDIEYFSNRRTADGAIYGTLTKPPFVKVKKGMYRIPTDSPEWLRLREPNGYKPDWASTSLWGAQIHAITSAAQLNNGFIRAGEATQILDSARLFRNPNTLGLQANSVLRSGKFEKVERGLYRLRDYDKHQPRLLSV